ncbi:MAG: DUF1573 domain-containing protein [Sphingobacteriales bacterium]|nr:MAG: DUF1573 domain-containing protein [Sphingobacteriales bacterium]
MKALFAALVCIACAGSVQAQQINRAGTAETAKKQKKAPKFKFKGGETFDFGEVKEGPEAEHVFEFTNTGKEPLIIQTASASCGCTTPEFSKAPVLPGKKGTITVRYSTQGRPGPFNKSVYISSNAVTAGERMELMIKGTVKAAPES